MHLPAEVRRLSDSCEISTNEREAVQSLSLNVIRAMADSKLDLEGQSAGVLYALLAWSERFPPKDQRRFAGSFAFALLHRCGDGVCGDGGIQELAMDIIDAMHASGLKPADQANALAHGLLAWSSNLTPSQRNRFLEDFVRLLNELRSVAEATIREETALQ
jgi:hypothetical protein